MIEQDCMKTCVVVVAREHGLAAADPRLQSGQSSVLAMPRRSVGPVSRPHGVGQRQPEVHMQRQRGLGQQRSRSRTFLSPMAGGFLRQGGQSGGPYGNVDE
jgi:hypothetical protein